MKLRGAWLACLLSSATALPAGATPTVVNTASSISVDNGSMALTLTKSNGNVSSLLLNGQQLLGSGGRIYTDVHFGTYHQLGSGNDPTVTYSVRSGSGWVDVMMSRPVSANVPLSITSHYVIRDNEAGIHLFTEVGHPFGTPDASIAEVRTVFRGNPGVFNNHSVSDDRFAIMPTAAELAAAPNVQDATDDLQGLGSAYPKRYYTKYDWSAYQKDQSLTGITGPTYGAWLATGNMESRTGGPMKQELTLHAGDTPILLSMAQGAHYGAKSVDASGEWSKTYGPFFLYFNSGPDLTSMRADASQYATPTFARDFYDTLSIPGYTTTHRRGSVSGKINLTGGESMDGAMVVLSEHGLEWQRATRGYNYWLPANPDGTFNFTNVRPSRYRVSVYKNGHFGEFTQDNVLLLPSGNVAVGQLNWTPADHGTDVFQIGRPDRTAGEFKHGDEARNFYRTFDYFADFPENVRYQIGESNPKDDWNYVQWRQWNGLSVGTGKGPGGTDDATWKVFFDLNKQLPTSGDAVLTVALAAKRAVTTLTVDINGHRYNWSIPGDDSSAAPRSGMSGLYLLREFNIPISDLVNGENVLMFDIGSNGSKEALYDAIRLEIPGYGQAPADFNGDDLVDMDDLQILANNWHFDGGLLQGDIDANRFIDLQDVHLLMDQWALSGTNPPIWDALEVVGLIDQVPEPAAGAMLMMFALMASRSRRRRA